MNVFPKLKFQLNVDLDKWTCNSSLFYYSNIKDYPDLAKVGFKNTFVADYYEIHKKELENAVEKMRNDWLRIEKQYFDATDKLFSNVWPEGKYICYLSIFNRNPRFIEAKEFQAFYRHPETTNYVCAHEMLHFIFYDYLEKNFNEKYKKLEGKYIWKLSEIFNDVVLRLPEFVSVTGQKDPPIYAETREELNQDIRLCCENKTVEVFVSKYIK